MDPESTNPVNINRPEESRKGAGLKELDLILEVSRRLSIYWHTLSSERDRSHSEALLLTQEALDCPILDSYTCHNYLERDGRKKAI